MKKRFSSALLALFMAFALLPVSAMAEASYQARWGTVGQGDVINWASSGDLAAAVSAANSSPTGMYIQLLSDVTTSGLTFTTSKATTLDLNGWTLSSGDTAAINHNGSGTLTITDSSDNKAGKVTITAPSASSTVISLGSASGSLVIDGSRISVNNGAAIINQTTGVVNVSDGTVESLSGYAIANRGTGSVIISGGTVSGGSSAIISLSAGAVSISGGIVSSSTSWGVYSNTGKIIIPSGSPIIKSGFQAMNKAPDMTGYLDAKITASESYDGSNPVAIYDPNAIGQYRYLKFTQIMAVKNTVTGTIYHSLQAAVDAITANNQTIQLLDNIELTNALTIESGNDKSFTIDLNGKTLASGVDDYAIRHNGSGTLTITDKSTDGGGKVTSGCFVTICLNGGKLTVDSGTVENTGFSTEPVIFVTIYNEGTGIITISGTAAVINKSSAAIWANAGTADTTILEISGGTIESTDGTAIENRESGKIVISGGSSTIKGGYQAMSAAPDLSGYGDVKVTASTNFDGSSPEHTYYSDGYYIKTYKHLKFEPAPDIARIGSKVYTKLQDAVDAITDNGQTIDLLGNINLSFPILITGENDKSFTLNLNGYTIDSNIRTAIRHSGSGTLTITDDSTEGGGVVTSINDNDFSGYTIFLDGGSLVVAGGIVENTRYLSHCDAICNNGTGSVSVVSSGMVKSHSGSAIYNNSTGKITISGAAKVTSGNRAVSDKGTIYLRTFANTEDILLEITGGTIENTDYGYAIYNRAHGKIAIPSGSPVVVGGYMAMNQAPDLSLYPNVKVTASKLSSGTPRVTYNANNIFYYRYLKFDPPTVVAKNTTTGAEYFAVQAAVDAAEDGNTVALLEDIDFVDPLEIDLKNNKTLTLDLKGKTFEGSIVYTCVSGKLTIDDTVGGGKITAPISSFDSGTIEASGSSANTAMLEIKGGTVENSDDTGNFGYGGNAILNKGCTVSVTGGTVTSAGGGAAILNTNFFPLGTVNVSGGTVINTDKYGSAAIYNQGTGTVSVSGGMVDGGTGIAIHNDSTGKITISGTAMVTGSRGVNLKAGAANTTVLEITGGTVESTAAGTGMAINHMNVGIVRISGGVVRATAEGGTAIRNHSAGKIAILGGRVEHTAVGKAIYNTGWGSIEIAGGTVRAENGEAICNEAYGTDILISSGTVSATVGTAIYNTSGFVRIVGGTAIIRGSNMAMNTEPDELDPSLKIMASIADANGADAFGITRGDIISTTIEEYYKNRVQAYKYFRFEPAYSVTYRPGANGTGSEAMDTKTPDVALTLRGAAFARDGYTQTGWATTDGGTKAYELGGSYTNNEAITLYPVWTQNPPDSYTVTYRPGANGTGSEAMDTKTLDVALTLRGAAFTRDGYTQTGWATTDGGSKAFELGGRYTANEAITLYPVWTQNLPAPDGNGGGTTPSADSTLPADTTVYNAPSKTSATIWLSGSGLSRNDILMTQAITRGSNYTAMLKLANSGDILHVYDISLKSGSMATGSAMYLTFDLMGQYAGQTFTLVHKMADGTFEYLYATAGVDGKVKFGPVYELSPFMLVKGRLLQIPSYAVVDVPKTGDSVGPVFFVLLLPLCAVWGAGVYRKKQA